MGGHRVVLYSAWLYGRRPEVWLLRRPRSVSGKVAPPGTGQVCILLPSNLQKMSELRRASNRAGDRWFWILGDEAVGLIQKAHRVLEPNNAKGRTDSGSQKIHVRLIWQLPHFQYRTDAYLQVLYQRTRNPGWPRAALAEAADRENVWRNSVQSHIQATGTVVTNE